MRTAIAIMLSAFLMFSLTSCKANTETLRGDVDNKNALRICIDISYTGADSGISPQKITDIDDFLLSLKESGGLENVVIEVLPENGGERSAAITRIRTEIMAGTGPDVFIVESGLNSDHSKSVFPFPEKSMDIGLFLPLDEYMENNTEFTEWDKQQPVVLAAGRNEEGQQIIPITYTFPVQTCYTSDFEMEYGDKLLTWQDTLTNPLFSDAYAGLNDCLEIIYSTDKHGNESVDYVLDSYLEHVLGKLVDYENEELLFTEEELLMRVNEILALQENATYEEKGIFTNQFMSKYAVNNVVPVTIMPMYSDDGGITASIRYFAAVNRNTKRPEDAFRVIDVLMRTHTQLTKNIFVYSLCDTGYGSIPLYDEAFHKDYPFDNQYFTDESLETFTQVKKQITAANFQTSLSEDLTMLLMRCQNPNKPKNVTVEGLVHAAYDSMQRKIRE